MNPAESDPRSAPALAPRPVPDRIPPGLKLQEDVALLQEQSETYRAAFVFLAEEMDKHVEALEILANNDLATKRILESALKLFEEMNERDKLIIEELDKK